MRAHFSPREIVCLPTVMIFAGKSVGIVSGVSFLPVSPLGGMVLRMGSGGVARFSYRALHQGDVAAILIRSDVQSDFA